MILCKDQMCKTVFVFTVCFQYLFNLDFIKITIFDDTDLFEKNAMYLIKFSVSKYFSHDYQTFFEHF